MGYQLIETIEVGSGGAASIEFTGIPQDGVDLVVLISGRQSAQHQGSLTVNSNTSGIYSTKDLTGYSDNAPYSQGDTNLGRLRFVSFNTAAETANTFSNVSIHFSNYTSSSSKSISIDSVTELNNKESFRQITAGVAATSSAITSVTVIGESGGTILEYSTASIYSIS
jgi:hypothetical protein